MDRFLPVAAAIVLVGGLLLRFLAGRRLRSADRSARADPPTARPEAPGGPDGDR